MMSMTADQLTERLIDLRRKFRQEIEEAKRKEDRANVLFEELYGLGVVKLEAADWRNNQQDNMGTPQELRDRTIRNLQQHLRSLFAHEAYELIREWIGVP